MSQYSQAMNAVRERLRAIGLPDTLFDADFAEQCAVAQERYERLQAKYEEMMKDEQWRDAAAHMPKHTKTGLEFLLLAQGPTTHWRKRLRMVNHAFIAGTGIRPRILKRMRNGGPPPERGTERAAALERAGYDVEKLWMEYNERQKSNP